MYKSKDILLKYWGHTSFRENQEEIINYIIKGKDTLALLPTGGGKSICFQVPSLIMKGICIVISPLISLMKDQIENINQKGIKAIAITSDMNFKELDIALTNCIFGGYKFLYLSPERLENKLVQSKISEMNVNLIAVDEAHCISKWGHNFRPSYRNISKIREIHPKIPILALTATANKEVIKDIQSNLDFKSYNTITSSFKRKNLSLIVIKKENKNNKLINILQKVKGSTIIYVKSRKDCVIVYNLLIKKNISANYYHAGVDIKNRNKIQNEWKNNKIRVMVATNAFGMGIDKGDVRLVIHFHIPHTIESYYQEIGRAGRDEKQAYTILIFNQHDQKYVMDFIELNSPSLVEIKECYQNLANYFQLAVNNGSKISFEFNLAEFSKKYKKNTIKVYNILKYLEIQHYLKFEEIYRYSSKVKIICSNSDLYKFQQTNNYFEPYIKILLRLYSGLFDDFVNINEEIIATKMKTIKDKIKDILYKLQELEIVQYQPKKNITQITYLQNRVENEYLSISSKKLKKKKINELKRVNYILDYCNQKRMCRSKILLEYFGEKENENCGKCDICRNNKMINLKKL